MAQRPALLTARGVDVARGGAPLLQGIDLTLHRGEVVAILGPNGVGKSTLLEVLAGLLPAGAGTIERAGRVAAALQAPAMARRSVQANVEAALGWWGVPRAERPGRATKALTEMRAAHLASRRATDLSGGETRRVHLARSLALEAEILLLDEPFAGLDPLSRSELLADATRALRDPKRATLVVVHDRAEAWALADRLVVLLGDGIAAEGAPRALLDQPPTPAVAAFLGFSGLVIEPDGSIVRARPSQVRVDPSGPIEGVIERRVPEEDGVLLEVSVPGGRLQVRTAHPGPADGDAIRLSLDGGVRFPALADPEGAA